MTMHERHKGWLAGRGIDPALAETFGLTTIHDGNACWLTVPYVHRGKTVNHKYRLTSEKRHKMDPGAPLTLWNADCLSDPAVLAGSPVVITEGEWDALAATTCGIKFAVSVPNGAPSNETNQPEEAKRYSWVWEHLDQLDKVKTFILAVDDDEPGRYLRQDLIALLGADRCRFVEYPFPCKDLNEVLIEYGQEALVECIHKAKHVPIKGLYQISEFPDVPEVRGFETGIDVLDPMMQIVPGTLTVFTGYSNMGKSTVLNTILANAISYNVPVCIASFETMPRPILVDGLAKALIGCSANEYPRHPGRKEAMEMLEQNVRIVTNALDDDLEFDLTTFLETVEQAVIRDGVKIVVLDPWNELEHKKGRDETLTEYVGRAIRQIKRFAKRYNVSFWVVAHPTKPAKGTNSIPSLYDISDSAHWSNKADYGLVYHRKDKTLNEADLAVVKVRMGLPGKCGVAVVKFDERVSRIRDFHA